MSSAFILIPEKKPGLFQKLLKKQPKENAVIRINNLLANSGDVRTVTMDAVSSIASEHRLNLGTEYLRDFGTIYARYVEHCLADGVLSNQDEEELRHLKGVLWISDADAKEAHEKVAGAIYRKAVEEAVADGFLNDREKKHLERVRIDLRISEELAKSIYADTAGAALRGFFNAAIADQKLSPEEEEELRRMAESLDFNVNHDAKTLEVLEHYRLFWQIDEGDLPVIIPAINLQKSEVCHAKVNASLHEIRKVTRRVSYGGVSTSYKVFKGFYIRSGSYNVGRQSEDVLTRIDSGELYLTNKRLIFMGSQKNVAIRTANILSFTRYSDGIEIEKGSGKNPFFLFSDDLGIFARILNRVIQEAS